VTDLRRRREASGLPQVVVSRRSGVPRVRLSQAELGQIRLRVEEEAKVRRVLQKAIEARAAEFQRLLATAHAEAPEVDAAQSA
jgi:transcriptional regulator with XRE-family HTH domain